MERKNIILGGGMTGLAAGMVSGLPVYEAAETPGGICSSYYIRPDSTERLAQAPDDAEAYHFEIGGGHWIFGGDPAVLRFIRSMTDVKSYFRRSSVFFPDGRLYIPYPLQNHLRHLSPTFAARALAEMARPKTKYRTMKEWLEQSFGPALCERFFHPFHNLYTDGLYERIAPQDDYKSPVDISVAIQGAFDNAPPVGYNVEYVYPVGGLNTLAQTMASRADVRYGHRAVKIDAVGKEITFSDGSHIAYDTLISTLPLNRMLELTDLTVYAETDPFTSVLVLNIGAIRGKSCPDDHWIYVAETDSGFHRVGFYSNVDRSFLPASSRKSDDKVSIYVERAYNGGKKPTESEIQDYSEAVIKELRAWKFIGDVEVVDPTWIDVAYTWSWPGSSWKHQALEALEKQDIIQIGRYGRWIFQGIADSIRDGFFVGATFKNFEFDGDGNAKS